MSTVLRRLLIVGAILALPVVVNAQEATISGTVTDSTGGVLPGVMVRAVHKASGNQFEVVTDERGAYRLAMRVGVYEVTAELQGFGTISRSVELLVGQAAEVNLQLSLSVVQESVTVTAEAPLIDTTQSKLGGNVDPKQMQELPVNGRNWMDLVTLAPGARSNEASSDGPTPGTSRRDFQINLDGQQVTTNLTPGASQPRISRDAIGEFQFLASRFDATQGRSSGVQVNAVSKSGSNIAAGSLSGYFRNDAFNAADFIQQRVLPYSDQQVSGTYGGPIVRDKVHFFANYEHEREPRTGAFTTAYPSFNFDLNGTHRVDMGGVRLDNQLSAKTRWMTRANTFRETVPYSGVGGATNHPASTADNRTHMKEVFTSLTQVLSNRALNELKVGWDSLYYTNENYTHWLNHPAATQGITSGSPRITFRGYAISGNANQPQRLGQDLYSIRDDLTYASGGHTLRAGGEFLYSNYVMLNCRNCMGIVDAQGGPIPANLAALFPVWNDPSTWNLAALSPIVRSYTLGIGSFRYNQRRKVSAAWLQDDWKVNSRLTLNLGARYDVALGMWANSLAIPPWLEANRPDDKNNVSPRAGFAYSLNDRAVVRGGFGYYYGEVLNNISSFTWSYANMVTIQVLNDGRPDFAANPFNGPIPTYAQALQRLCSNSPGPTCLRPAMDTVAPPPEYARVPRSYQASIGFERQLSDTMAVQADYAYIGGRDERYGQGHVPQQNWNLTYDPVTGVNYPFTDISKRPYPDWGVVEMESFVRRSNYHGVQTAFTKRFSHRWQASGTYTLSWLYDSDPLPFSGFTQVSFPVPPDLGGEYGLAETDQRHRAVFNGIWDVGYGFQLSGLYFYGSGRRYANYYGGDLRQTGRSNGRLRPDGTIVPRNSFVGDPLHRVDVRIQKRVPVWGHVRVDGIVEVFDLFNHANYGSYTLAESNASYGQPAQNTNFAYAPRMLQLGFRATF